MANTDKRTDQMVIRIPREEITQLQRIAAAKGYSLSELVRMACRRVLRGAMRFESKRTESAVQPRLEQPAIPAA